MRKDVSQQPRQFCRVSNELYCLDGEWFFQTSEHEHGPFTKREAAEQALERFDEEAAADASKNSGAQLLTI